MGVALDTNVLAYAEGLNGADMKRTALELVEKSPESAVLSCRLLLSQGLQEGFACNGGTDTNPFATKKNDLLIALLADNAQS